MSKVGKCAILVRMRKVHIAVMAVFATGWGQAATGMSGGDAELAALRGWRYGLPDTGILPSYAQVEWYSRMGERHGGSELSMQSYSLIVPLSDPRKTGWEKTMLNLQFNAKLTCVNTGGTLDLRNDELYNFALPITFIRPVANGNCWTYGVAPEIAADCKAVDKGIDLAAYAFYTVKHSKTFSYSLGLAMSPRFAEYLVLPMLRFEWEPCEDWVVKMSGYELAAMYQATERLSFGPFVAARGGVWAVDTDRGDRIFRVRSLVVGGMFEYDFSRPGQTKRIITASVGSTVTTNAQFLERNARKDSFGNHHYKPAFYVSAGVDFRF